MRVCIVADSASVRFGGEAILPFHYFRLLRQRGVESWLVVHDRTRGELDAMLPAERDRIIYTQDTMLHRRLYQFSTLLPRRVAEATIGLLSHLLTQGRQKALIRRLIREQRITVIHQPTPVSPRLPSLIFGFGVPVVMGPLNGGMDYPAAFREHESSFSRLSVLLARHCSNLVNRILPGKLQAAAVLVANERTREALPGGIRGEVFALVENAVDPATWRGEDTSAGSDKQEPRRRLPFLFIGRLVDWKRVDIAIQALALVPGADLTVVGEGPMRPVWEELAVQAGVPVRFAGWQSHAECAKLLAVSEALLLPSIYECGGAVVLEAMAAGRPVIATRWGGPSDYVDGKSGFLIEPKGPEAMVRDFAAAMQRLANDPELSDRMGRAGRERVLAHFTWSAKIDQIIDIYASVAASKAGS